MVMILENVVPFGRSLDEYRRMFNLSASDLAGTIVGLGDGPASFNAEGTKLGYNITSIDPIYTFTGSEIESRFNQVVDTIISQVKATNSWVWSYHASPEALRQARVRALNYFLADYELGKQEGRYQIGELPKTSFSNQQFSLALCSHLLFLYSEQLNYEFHERAIAEMLRVAAEVRIFPLLTLRVERSPYVDKVMSVFAAQGYTVSVQTVGYELQKGGNQMLVIRHAAE